MVWELVVRTSVVFFSPTRVCAWDLPRGVSLFWSQTRDHHTPHPVTFGCSVSRTSLQQLWRLSICSLFQSFLVRFYYISVSQFSSFFFLLFFFFFFLVHLSLAITRMWTSTPAQPSALYLRLLRTVAENSRCSQPVSLYSSFHLHLAFVSKLWSLIYCSVVSLKVT